MKFTKKEYDSILKERAKEIETYIESEIQPYITEEIKIDFGDYVRRGRYGEVKEREFTLIIRKDCIFGNCGGLVLYFKIPYYMKNCCGSIDIYDDWTYGGRFIYDLCSNWQSVKGSIITMVKCQKIKKERVFDKFKI